MNLIAFLSLNNWKMFSKISMTFGGKNQFYVSRIILISPLILFLCYKAYTDGLIIKLLIIFVLSDFIMEITRVSNRCFYDPIHFFFFNSGSKRKFISIWLAEFFGIKFSLFAIFIGISIVVGNPITTTLVLLVFIYVALTTMHIGLSIIGNRIKIVSSLYQWALIMIFSFLIASLGIFGEGMDFLPFTTSVESWMQIHLGRMIWVGSLTVVSVFLLTLFGTHKVYKARPFINPASFPKKMI